MRVEHCPSKASVSVSRHPSACLCVFHHCHWLHSGSFHTLFVIMSLFLAPQKNEHCICGTMAPKSCRGKPWPLNCVKFTSFMGRWSANMQSSVRVGANVKTFTECLGGFTVPTSKWAGWQILLFYKLPEMPLVGGQFVKKISFLWLMAELQWPKQHPQYDVLFQLKPYSPGQSLFSEWFFCEGFFVCLFFHLNTTTAVTFILSVFMFICHISLLNCSAAGPWLLQKIYVFSFKILFIQIALETKKIWSFQPFFATDFAAVKVIHFHMVAAAS